MRVLKVLGRVEAPWDRERETYRLRGVSQTRVRRKAAPPYNDSSIESAPLQRSLNCFGTNRVRILEMPVKDVPRSIFNTLKAGSIVFVDSAHDVCGPAVLCFELFEILRLPRGVLVHIRDMFWPLSPRWIVDESVNERPLCRKDVFEP